MKPAIITEIETNHSLGLKKFDGKKPEDIVLHRHRGQYSADDDGNLTGINLCEVWKEKKEEAPHTPGAIESVSSGQLAFLSQPDTCEHLLYLNLSNCGIETLTLAALNLIKTDLSVNPLKTLTFLHQELPALETLDLNECTLTQLNLPKLPALCYLDVARNKTLEKITFTGSYPQLHTVDASDNKLQEFLLPPDSVANLKYVYLQNNKELVNPQPEIVNQGVEAVVNFLKEINEGGEVTIYEAKLCILGDAGAGKTSLQRKIRKPEAELPAVEETTIGVEVVKHIFPKTVNKPEFTMNIWDFGGQYIYHTIHRFFLSKRSLYVLMLDGRREEEQTISYWLQTQQVLCGNSPMILVGNKKGGIEISVKVFNLTKDFLNVQNRQLIEVDLKEVKSEEDIKSLKDDIEHQIRKLPQFKTGEKVPRKWSLVRNELNDKAVDGINHISLSEFRKICKKHGIDEDEKQDFLCDYLHDLGALLHFTDDVQLNTLVILKHEWATKAVYEMLNHTKQKKSIKPGHFSFADLKSLWKDEHYTDYHGILLALMLKFELCYQTPENKNLYIVPNLLPDNPPENYKELAEEKLTCYYYTYSFMPAGILSRLIVKLHQYIANDIVWKGGMVLEIKEAGDIGSTTANVRELSGENKIEIKIAGFNMRGLFAIIRKEFSEIHQSYTFPEDKSPDIEVPCICDKCTNKENKPTYHKYQELVQRLNANIQTIECRKNNFKPVPIAPMLDVFNEASIRLPVEPPPITVPVLPPEPTIRELWQNLSYKKVPVLFFIIILLAILLTVAYYYIFEKDSSEPIFKMVFKIASIFFGSIVAIIAFISTVGADLFGLHLGRELLMLLQKDDKYLPK